MSPIVVAFSLAPVHRVRDWGRDLPMTGPAPTCTCPKCWRA